MKFSKSFLLPLASAIVLTGALLAGIPAARSSASGLESATPHSVAASEEIRLTVDEGRVLLIQTRGGEVARVPGAEVVILTGIGVTAIEDEGGNVIRISENLGGASDVIATAMVTETEALQMLESGAIIVPLDSK